VDWLDFSASALRMAVPVLICALGALYSERSGVVNIGLEGMMITGAFWGAFGALYAGPLAGIAFAVAAGMLMALLHAFVTVTCRIDQIVSGVAINILAFGLARFFCFSLYGMATNSPAVSALPKHSIAGLPELSVFVPLAFALTFLAWFVLERTVFGLRLKSAGENPAAADSLGVNVAFYQYAGVIVGGALAGLAGAYLSVEHTGMYVEGMTQGKGFIALAAMIFGNWRPGGTLLASLIFGCSEALSIRGIPGLPVPYQFIKMLPYVVTLAVLAGAGPKSRPPAAVGLPYSRIGKI
jgi:simple sugar transport system permease protein